MEEPRIWMHPPRDLTPQLVPEAEMPQLQRLGWLHADAPADAEKEESYGRGASPSTADVLDVVVPGTEAACPDADRMSGEGCPHESPAPCERAARLDAPPLPADGKKPTAGRTKRGAEASAK